MRATISKLFNDQDAELGGKITGLLAVLIAANVLAWVWALIAFHDYPVLVGTAFLAYTFGLRHAVDADHIAAIDNVTRKLMQEGKRPVSVGLFFSLGHSTVVVLGIRRGCARDQRCSKAASRHSSWSAASSARWCRRFFCFSSPPRTCSSC